MKKSFLPRCYAVVNCKVRLIFSLVLLVTLHTHLFAQCDTNAINSVSKKYEAMYNNLNKKADSIDLDGPNSNTLKLWLNFDDIKFKMVEKQFHLDLISVTMKDKKVSFNTPQVTMSLKKFSFNKPATKMVKTKIGEKPNIICKGLIPKCKVYWTPIYTDLPTVTVERQEIKSKIPQITYAATSFITAVPQFKKDRKTISFKLPEITVIKASAGAKTIREKTEVISKTADSLSVAQEQELAVIVANTFICTRDSLVNQQKAAEHEFDNALLQIDSAIRIVVASGGDPSKILADDNTIVNLLTTKDEIVKSQAEAKLKFDLALADLNDKIKKGIGALHAVEQEVIAAN